MAVRTSVDMGSPATIALACRVRAGYYVPTAYADGYRDGLADGFRDGFPKGVTYQRPTSHQRALAPARAQGFADGYEAAQGAKPRTYADGYDAGACDAARISFTAGATFARAASYDRGAAVGREAARWPAFMIGFAAGASGPGPDTTAPAVTIVSPTPGVAAGQPDGFPRDFDQAKLTPVVLLINDLAPGLKYACVVVRFGQDGNEIEEVVYRRGLFRGLYRKLSSAIVTATGVSLTVARAGGWLASPDTNQLSTIIFDVDATDAVGNLDA